MIKVFLVVVACFQPDFTRCVQLMAAEITNEADPMYWCLLNRPATVALWQLRVDERLDGWITFSRCKLINTEKNERLG